MIFSFRPLKHVTKQFTLLVLLASSMTLSVAPFQAVTAQAESKPADKAVAKGSAAGQTQSGVQSPGGKPVTGGRPRVIELGAVWCAPCKKFAPIFERAKTAYASKADFQSLDVDTPDGRAFALKHKAPGVPVVVIVDGSGKEVYNHLGLLDEATFNAEVNKALH